MPDQENTTTVEQWVNLWTSLEVPCVRVRSNKAPKHKGYLDASWEDNYKVDWSKEVAYGIVLGNTPYSVFDIDCLTQKPVEAGSKKDLGKQLFSEDDKFRKSLEWLQDNTFSVQSPSGGGHHYFIDKRPSIISETHALKVGVDCRRYLFGDWISRGLLIGPGSTTKDGEYVLTNGTKIKELTTELLEKIGLHNDKYLFKKHVDPKVIKPQDRNTSVKDYRTVLDKIRREWSFDEFLFHYDLSHHINSTNSSLAKHWRQRIKFSNGRNIPCISDGHEDQKNDPTLSLFRGDDGVYRFECHGGSCTAKPNHGDLIDFIQYLFSVSQPVAVVWFWEVTTRDIRDDLQFWSNYTLANSIVDGYEDDLIIGIGYSRSKPDTATGTNHQLFKMDEYGVYSTGKRWVINRFWEVRQQYIVVCRQELWRRGIEIARLKKELQNVTDDKKKSRLESDLESLKAARAKWYKILGKAKSLDPNREIDKSYTTVSYQIDGKRENSEQKEIRTYLAEDMITEGFSQYIGTPTGVLDLLNDRAGFTAIEDGAVPVSSEQPRTLTKEEITELGLTITQTTKVSYNPNAKHWAVDMLLDHLMGMSKEVGDYLLRELGFSLFGSPSRRFFIIHGKEDIGKSTLFEAVCHCLGLGDNNYSFTPDFDVLSKNMNTESPSPNKLRLQRKLLCYVDEDDEGKLTSGFVKKVSAGGPFGARDLYESPIYTQARSTIWITVNKVPELEFDKALFDRLRSWGWAEPKKKNLKLQRVLYEEPSAQEALFKVLVEAAHSTKGKKIMDIPEGVKFYNRMAIDDAERSPMDQTISNAFKIKIEPERYMTYSDIKATVKRYGMAHLQEYGKQKDGTDAVLVGRMFYKKLREHVDNEIQTKMPQTNLEKAMKDNGFNSDKRGRERYIPFISQVI